MREPIEVSMETEPKPVETNIETREMATQTIELPETKAEKRENGLQPTSKPY